MCEGVFGFFDFDLFLGLEGGRVGGFNMIIKMFIHIYLPPNRLSRAILKALQQESSSLQNLKILRGCNTLKKSLVTIHYD